MYDSTSPYAEARITCHPLSLEKSLRRCSGNDRPWRLPFRSTDVRSTCDFLLENLSQSPGPRALLLGRHAYGCWLLQVWFRSGA